MLNPGEFRRQISIELNAAYGDGLLSEQTLAHRLDLVLSGRLLDPERLIGDLSLRASRRSRRNTVGRGVDSLRDTFTRRKQPTRRLATAGAGARMGSRRRAAARRP